MNGRGASSSKPNIDLYFIIILIITLTVPVIILPYVIDNCFNTPKNLTIILGVALMIGIYCTNFFRNHQTRMPSGPTFTVLIFLIILNMFSFFYTGNYYFTAKAAILNISCLIIFYFVSMSMDDKKIIILLSVIVFSGILVSFISVLQFNNIFLFIKWSKPDVLVMGTIGNSNYLGAYLVFPLYAATGLIFILKGKLRLIPLVLALFILCAFLFSRARASWMGFFLALPFFLYLVKVISDFSIMVFIRSNPRKVAVIGVLSIFILGALVFAAPERFYKQMNYKNVFESRTLILRMKKYFPPSIWLFKQNPILGTGLWSYRNMVYKAQAEINRVDPDYFKNYPSPKPRRAHNEYLEILNDGGLLAAAALLLFLTLIMRHGWSIIRDENVKRVERMLTAISFSSITAIMLTSIFFFSFRVNSTMLMTVLMLGIMEGIYLRHNNLVVSRDGFNKVIGKVLLPMVLLVLIAIVWFQGIRPFEGEVEHFRYKLALTKRDGKAAERHILKAIEYDPHNSAYHVYAAQVYFNVVKDYVKACDYVERSINDFNGDVTLYSIHYLKGIIKYRMGSLFEAREAFKMALYYNPTLKEARDRLADVENIIKDHDVISIRFK